MKTPMVRPAKSGAAIRRELHRLERWCKKVRRRNRRLGVEYEARDETRLDAARQALAWAAGENAMSMSRIAVLNEQVYRWVARRERRDDG